MIITRRNPFDGETYAWDIPVREEQLDAWKRGALIQDAMPNLSPDQREFIMTGITPDTWPGEIPSLARQVQ